MGGTKALFGLVVGLGILILAGFGLVVATLVHRVIDGAGHVPPLQYAGTAVTLDEPVGTRIGALVAAGDRLALLLEGGGVDRVVLLDPRDGSRIGTVVVTGPSPTRAPMLPP